jgi:hypothetical protein
LTPAAKSVAIGGFLVRETPEQIPRGFAVPDLSDLECLVAIEAIKQLKSRRDRAVDMKDWKALVALHAPDHQSFVEGFEPCARPPR